MVVNITVPFGYPKYQVPYYNKDPKGDHNLNNHPYIPCSPGTVTPEASAHRDKVQLGRDDAAADCRGDLTLGS